MLTLSCTDYIPHVCIPQLDPAFEVRQYVDEDGKHRAALMKVRGESRPCDSKKEALRDTLEKVKVAYSERTAGWRG